MVRPPILATLVLCLAALVGCDAAEKTLDSTVGIAKQGIDKISPAAKEAQDVATGEFEKMFRQEYLVRDFAPDTTPLDLERKLNGMGAERWQCFSIQQLADGTTRVFCHRTPISYLKYALQYFPGI